MYDTIVVGGGITGLQLGALLANDGEKVLLLEKNARLGGRAKVDNKNGFILDYGIHLIRFGPNSAISKTCRMLGHEVDYHDLGTSWVKDEDGRIKLFPTSPKAFLRSRLLSFKDKIKVAFLMGRIRRGTEAKELLEQNVAKWMDDNMITGGLRRYFHMVSASMMVCPFIERSSVGEMLINMQKVLLGGISVMYPKGGWQPLMDLFAEKIRENGDIRLKSTVSKLDISRGGVKGVYVGDELIPGKKVVLSLPSINLPDILPDSVSEKFIESCKNNRPTAGIVIDYCLKKKISDITGLCYMYAPMSFGMFTSNIEPSLAPEGKQILTWLQPLPEKKIKDSAWGKKRAAELENALFSFFPPLKDNIEWKRVLYLPMVDGTEVNVNQIESKRPSSVVPGIKNLFLVGDSISAPGAGGDIGHESVHLTYEKIVNTN